MWPFKRSHVPKEDLSLEDKWIVSEGEHDGRPLIVRVNHGVAAAVGHPAYSHQVGVAVPLRAPDPRGFPEPEESEQLDVLEDLLAARLGPERRCLQVAVISTGGMREFVFYSSNPEATRAAIEQIAGEVSTHEVQHIIQADPKWKVYRQFV